MNVFSDGVFFIFIVFIVCDFLCSGVVFLVIFIVVMKMVMNGIGVCDYCVD